MIKPYNPGIYGCLENKLQSVDCSLPKHKTNKEIKRANRTNMEQQFPDNGWVFNSELPWIKNK